MFVITIFLAILGFVFFIGILLGSEMKDFESNFDKIYKVVIIMISVIITFQFMNLLISPGGIFYTLIYSIVILALAFGYSKNKGEYTCQQLGDAHVNMGTVMISHNNQINEKNEKDF